MDFSFTFTLRRAAVTTCSRRVVGPDKAPKLWWRADVRETVFHSCSSSPGWFEAGHIYPPATSIGFGTTSTYPRIHVSTYPRTIIVDRNPDGKVDEVGRVLLSKALSPKKIHRARREGSNKHEDAPVRALTCPALNRGTPTRPDAWA